jgi:hypothetical protein
VVSVTVPLPVAARQLDGTPRSLLFRFRLVRFAGLCCAENDTFEKVPVAHSAFCRANA